MNRAQLKHTALQTWSQAAPLLGVSAISSTIEVIVGMSYATLLCSGSLSPYVSVGITITLLTAIISRTLLGFLSSFRGILAQINESTVIILAIVVQSIQTTLPDATAEEIWVTIAVAIALSSILSGLFLTLLGQLKLAELVRFIPYPVIGGFLAGIGWLLIRGGVQIMVGSAPTFPQLLAFFQHYDWVYWLPGMGFGVLLLLLSRRFHHPLLLPLSLLAATGLFFGLAGINGISIATLRSQGWLLESFSSGQLVWQSFSPSALSTIQWNALLQHVGSIGAIILLNAIDILLNISALELVMHRDVNLNHELKAAGIVNMVSGLGGGLNSSYSFFDSSLAHRFGANSRMMGLVSALLIGLLFFHLPLLSYVPKPVLGGLLIFIGLSLLADWLYDTWFKLTRSDYCIIALILLIIMAIGLLAGISIGIIIAILFFVINYSRVHFIRHSLSGVTYQSSVTRPVHQVQLLQQQGSQIYILELQGFLFFGTASRLIKMVRQRLDDAALLPLRFVLLDFRLVNGLDSSAVMSFVKLRYMADQKQFQLVLTHLNPAQQTLLTQSGCILPEDPICRLRPDLDSGVEWCEDQLLEGVWRRKRFLPLLLQLKQLFTDSAQVTFFMQYLEPQHLPQGTVLFEQGQRSDAVYFLEAGQLSTVTQRQIDRVSKLQTVKAGAVLGELDFYRRSPYSTTVLADQASTVYSLSRDGFEQMQQNHPAAAASFQAFIIQLLADRLVQSQKQIESLRS